MARALGSLSSSLVLCAIFFAPTQSFGKPRFWERAKEAVRAESDPGPALRRILEGRGTSEDAASLGGLLRKIRARDKVRPEIVVLALLAGSELGYVRLDAGKEPEIFLRLAEAGLNAKESGAKAHAFFLRAKMLAATGASPERELRVARDFAVDVEQRESIELSLALEAVFEESGALEPEIARLAEESSSKRHRLLAELVLFLNLAQSGETSALRFLRSAKVEAIARQNVAGTNPWGGFAIRPELVTALESLLELSLDGEPGTASCGDIIGHPTLAPRSGMVRLLGCDTGSGR